MDNKHIRIAVGIDQRSWHEKFANALESKIEQGFPVSYQIVDLNQSDWVQALQPFDAVIWNPSLMGVVASGHYKEKIYFIEQHLGKVVVPNLSTIWHFESKIAQSYLFANAGIKTPHTTVSFQYRDAMNQLGAAQMPIVWKKSHGAESQNVRLIRDRRTAEQLIANAFCQQLWDAAKTRSNSQIRRQLACVGKRWFWAKVRQKLMGDERYGAVYWQEFIPDNPADLRITVIGDRFAFGFWRNNRPNDFRASGSGRRDYERAIPETQLRYCIAINRQLGFDSMCYDILFQQDDFVINEMSYAYTDSAIYNAKGYYELDDNGQLKFREGHTLPQQLWVEWALRRASREVMR